jgi:hypothetical protein
LNFFNAKNYIPLHLYEIAKMIVPYASFSTRSHVENMNNKSSALGEITNCQTLYKGHKVL